MIHDEQFGPVVLLGFGGVHVEALADVVYALPPFDAAEARAARGSVEAECAAPQPAPQAPARRHRVLPASRRDSPRSWRSLGEHLSEMDLNPVIVHGDGCVIVDALVVARAPHDLLETRARQA